MDDMRSMTMLEIRMENKSGLDWCCCPGDHSVSAMVMAFMLEVLVKTILFLFFSAPRYYVVVYQHV